MKRDELAEILDRRYNICDTYEHQEPKERTKFCTFCYRGFESAQKSSEPEERTTGLLFLVRELGNPVIKD